MTALPATVASHQLRGFLAKFGLGALVAALGISALWGFTVDDAFIAARTAFFLAREGHWGFNLAETTDSVTPLFFAPAQAFFGALAGGETARDFFEISRWTGAFAWVLACGCFVASSRSLWRSLLFVALFACGHAWASAGLATPWAALALTLSVVVRQSAWGHERSGAISAGALGGLAAALRPELAPMSLCLIWALPKARGWVSLGWAVPTLITVGLRLFLFGEPLPLSFLAKAPELQHGLFYSLSAIVYSGLFWFSVAGLPRGNWRRFIVVWAMVGASLVFSGGDWMPLFRLVVPLSLPLLLFCEQRQEGDVWSLPSQVGWVCIGGGLLLWGLGPRFADAKRTLVTREAMVDDVGKFLPADASVAAVDIGWLGLRGRAPVIDLAGVTSPPVAKMFGGHTSKRIPRAYLEKVGAQYLVFRLRQCAGPCPRLPLRATYEAEGRLLAQFSPDELSVVGSVPIPRTASEYVVFRLVTLGH